MLFVVAGYAVASGIRSGKDVAKTFAIPPFEATMRLSVEARQAGRLHGLQMVANRQNIAGPVAPMSKAPPPCGDLAGWMVEYGPGLRRFFARRANSADVDDLVQDVFIRMQTAQLSHPIENADRYLFRVAQNVLISRHRADASRGRHLHSSYEDQIVLGDELSPERIAIGRDEYARVVQAIADLPPRARAAFVFHRFENMTYQAISIRMGISKDSVKELIHRALVRLVDIMENSS